MLIVLLTLLTQIGGLLLWIAYGVREMIDKKQGRFSGRATLASFVLLYGLLTAVVVPAAAPHFGRHALNCFANEHDRYQANSLFYCALNRHYVTPKLKRTLEVTAAEMARRHPDSVIGYLDAGFPFDLGLPLLPHLSHNSGRQLDLAFFYKDGASGEPLPEGGLWFLGYWAFAPAWKLPYADRGTPKDGLLRWRFAWLQGLFEGYELDRKRTGDLVALLSRGPASRDVRRIFLEPYLKKPLNVSGSKIRFAGWNAARHDDHIHFEVSH